MAITVALVVSTDPFTIQQVSHGLLELSITPDVCREVPASICLLNYRKFDAVVVDLQLGEEAGVILDAVRFSKSNPTAVTLRSAAVMRKEPLSGKGLSLSLSGLFLCSQSATHSNLPTE